MNVLAHIDKLLVAGGIDTNIIKLGSRPDQPTELIALYQSSGLEPDPNMTAKTIQDLTVQAYVRSNTYDSGADLLEEVRTILHQLPEQTVTVDSDSIRIMKILARSEGGHIGTDSAQGDLDEFTINFGVKCHVTS